jgi:hypothetical protein
LIKGSIEIPSLIIQAARVARKFDPDALQDVLLPMEGQGILVLRDRDMRQEPGRGHGLRQRLRRQRCGLDAHFAMGAGVFFPYVPKDPDLCRDDVEFFLYLPKALRPCNSGCSEISSPISTSPSPS